jgi:KDO2-lipid IV(A) lauroyltransferase
MSRSRVVDRLTYLAVRGFLLGLAALPRRAGLGAGALLGRALYPFLRRRRRVALANLERAYGATLDAAGRARLARASLAHLGRICADAAYAPRLLRAPIERVATVEGFAHLEAARAEGRGVLVFSGHFGHWEMIGLVQPRLGIPFAMIVRPLENPHVDRLLAGVRIRAGNTLIPKREAARGVMKALREGRAVAILIDQNVRGEAGIFVDFFGVPASTTPALATFAFKTGAPIVPVFCDLLPDGRGRIRYLPALHAARRGPLNDDVRDLTRTCTAILEREVRRRPETWFWMHDRWRTRPPQSADGAGLTAAGAGVTAESGTLRRSAAATPAGSGS